MERKYSPSVEALENREVLSTTSLFSPVQTDAVVTPNFEETARMNRLIVDPSHVEIEAMNAKPDLSVGQAGYPAPDDDGPWGPLGPLVKNALDEVFRVESTRKTNIADQEPLVFHEIIELNDVFDVPKPNGAADLGMTDFSQPRS